MKAKVILSDQVLEFIRQLSPVPRKNLRMELGRLQNGKANIKSLVEPLDGYHRLRSGSYRVIFRCRMLHGQQVAECIYAGPRRTIYELFQEVIVKN